MARGEVIGEKLDDSAEDDEGGSRRDDDDAGAGAADEGGEEDGVCRLPNVLLLVDNAWACPLTGVGVFAIATVPLPLPLWVWLWLRATEGWKGERRGEDRGASWEDARRGEAGNAEDDEEDDEEEAAYRPDEAGRYPADADAADTAAASDSCDGTTVILAVAP